MHRGTCIVYRMATQKRRVVYLSDEAWEAAKRQAEPFGLSISAYIQSLIIGGRIVPQFIRDAIEASERALEEELHLDPTLRVEHNTLPLPMSQAQRDAILRRVNKGG